MFPNPSDALPLPPRPNLQQYKKLAKELANAVSDPNEDSVLIWATRWVESLTRLNRNATPLDSPQLREQAARTAQFARRTLEAREATGKGGPARATKGALTAAQLVLARSHGFASWSRFSEHLDRLAHASSSVAQFEAAADAIVDGDLTALKLLLAANPELIRQRSSREHRAMLLHYTAANGVEDYRQRCPANAVEILLALLAAGADVDAEANLYGGTTTLELAATSGHPQAAGVQIALMDQLLAHGASMTPELHSDRGGHRRISLVEACLANGRLLAAEYLAGQGAPLSLAAAAALGRLERVREHCDSTGTGKANAEAAELEQGFLWACQYGQIAVIEFLLDRGMPIDTKDKHGQTGLHWAVIGGGIELARILLRRNAPLEMRNVYGGTALGQALWSAQHGGDPKTYDEIIQLLLAAGAVPIGDDADNDAENLPPLI